MSVLTARPPVVHRIWLDEPMPEVFAGYGDRWRQLNPGWTVVDWQDSSDLPPMDNRDLFDRARQIYPRDWKRFQADLLRLELLWRFGGVYADTDVEPLEPIEGLLGNTACLVGRSPQHKHGVHPITNAFMAARQHHGYLRALVDGVPAAVDVFGHRPLAQSVGPWHLTRTYAGGRWPDVTVLGHEKLYGGRWFTHHWNTRLRRRGRGLG